MMLVAALLRIECGCWRVQGRMPRHGPCQGLPKPALEVYPCTCDTKAFVVCHVQHVLHWAQNVTADAAPTRNHSKAACRFQRIEQSPALASGSKTRLKRNTRATRATFCQCVHVASEGLLLLIQQLYSKILQQQSTPPASTVPCRQALPACSNRQCPPCHMAAGSSTT
jgi:hypothetical protein